MTALFSPPDIDAAYEEWQATCGPCAVAALLGKPVNDCRELFPGYRGWVNPTGIKAALDLAGIAHRPVSLKFYWPFYWPLNGLAFIQFEGPWTAPGVHFGAAYKRTHWIAVRTWKKSVPANVYDCNVGQWQRRNEWEAGILPDLMAAHKGCTGWHVRSGIEVELATRSIP